MMLDCARRLEGILQRRPAHVRSRRRAVLHTAKDGAGLAQASNSAVSHQVGLPQLCPQQHHVAQQGDGPTVWWLNCTLPGTCNVRVGATVKSRSTCGPITSRHAELRARMISSCCTQVTTNWKDLDDLAGSRASGLEGVGATAASFGGATKGP